MTDQFSKGLYLVLITALISGFSIFINNWAVKGFDPYAFTFSKNVLVAIFLLSALGVLKEHKEYAKLSKIQWAKLVAIGFIGGSVPFLMFFKGLQLITGAAASFIHKTMFIYVGFLAFVFLKEKIRPRMFLGALALLIGNFLLLKISGFSFGTGELLILGATLLWAGENTLSKHVLSSVPPRIVAFSRMFFGTLFMLPFLMYTGSLAAISSYTLDQIAWVAVTSLFLFGFVITYYTGLRGLPVSVATTILLLGSVITTALQFTFLDKPVTIPQAFGMLLLVIGVASIIGFSTSISLIIRLPSAIRHGRH